ncbi:NUDIX hydrolase, partial [Candidatus Woesearchaeota archaeon]|nr:NUDIX hydrolase [Candidatus Woesearchaeota archaeon]
MKKEIKLAVDAVVFTILNRNLKILLIKRKFPPFKSMSALPGGFVLINENLDQAVARELHEETNVKNIFLKQFKTYGDVHRDPRGRIVSVAFMALIDGEKVKLKSRMDAERA